MINKNNEIHEEWDILSISSSLNIPLCSSGTAVDLSPSSKVLTLGSTNHFSSKTEQIILINPRCEIIIIDSQKIKMIENDYIHVGIIVFFKNILTL
jgi:hypothetical protein